MISSIDGNLTFSFFFLSLQVDNMTCVVLHVCNIQLAQTKFSYYFDLFFQYNILDTFSIVKVDATFRNGKYKKMLHFYI